MKVDLCTWTKNEAETLIPVLKRIERVIPLEEVRQKTAVDDSRVDSTVKILKESNWKVYPNPKASQIVELKSQPSWLSNLLVIFIFYMY